MIDLDISASVAVELSLKKEDIFRALVMLDEGSTVPFIARYRKEEIGGLTDTDLLAIIALYKKIDSFNSRRETILNEIKSQDKLTKELEDSILSAKTLLELEDLYRPYKPKRSTRGSKAKAAGLETLAQLIEEGSEYEGLIEGYIVEAYPNKEKVLQGALDIIAEKISDTPKIRTYIKNIMDKTGQLVAEEADKAKDQKQKFRDYYGKSFRLNSLKSSTYLAINRGEKEGVLKKKYIFPEEDILNHINSNYISQGNTNMAVLARAIKDAYTRLILPSVTNDLDNILFEKAEDASIPSFAHSLNDILMKPPYKADRILGFDPGFHHGCKLAVIDGTGKVVATDVIYPTTTAKASDVYIGRFKEFLKKHKVKIIALGNGTATRESEDFIKKAICDMKDIHYEVVSEDGASIYSVTKVAQDEFPNFEPNLRSAISIARRLLDPLSELVKIDPWALGVGQYQHDIDEKKLKESLSGVVVNTVNNVGVDINTASYSLLVYVSGLSSSLSQNIIEYIDKQGRINSRKELRKIKGFGPKAFENAAGFLRITDGDEPLDATSIHPESYPVVKRLLKDLRLEYPKDIDALSKLSKEVIGGLAVAYEVTPSFLSDIVNELIKQKRDPRGEPQILKRDDKIRSINDLTVNYILQGTITNVLDFGLFVDLGIHISGLVHISSASKKYLDKEQLRAMFKVGQILTVRVIAIDLERERISLSLNLDPTSPK